MTAPQLSIVAGTANSLDALVHACNVGDAVARREAAGALRNLTELPRTHAHVRELGGIVVLARIAGDADAGPLAHEYAAGAIANLANCEHARLAIADHAGLIKARDATTR